jgi:ATP-binding cassette subfamily C (CFTR/MRP) protein 1
MKPRSVAPIPSPYPPPADPPLQAAVDVETDAMLQTTLRSNMFKNRTIITIAHRINTILDSDRIIVLSQGQVAEFDTPAELVRKKGLFYELVKEANLLSSLEVAS